MKNENYVFTNKELEKVSNIGKEYADCMRRLKIKSGGAKKPWWDLVLSLIDNIRFAISEVVEVKQTGEYYRDYSDLEKDYLILREATEIVLADRLHGDLVDIMEVQEGAEKWLKLI